MKLILFLCTFVIMGTLNSFAVDPLGKQLADYAAKDTSQSGEDCFQAAYNRLNHIYKQNAKKLPSNTDGSDFAFLWSSHCDNAVRWKKIDAKYRASGPPGSLVSKDLGELVNHDEIWAGNLKPGAIIQVWDIKDANERPTGVRANGVKVFNGIHKAEKVPKYMGHVFIFLKYERDVGNKIIGMRIADQGSGWDTDIVKPSTFGLWIGVNLKD